MSDHLPVIMTVSTAPSILSSVSPGQPADLRDRLIELRRDIEATVQSLPEGGPVLLLAAGSRGLHDHATSDLRPLGVDAAPVELPVETELIGALTRRVPYPRVQRTSLGLDLSILVRIVARLLGDDVAVVPISVPARAQAEALRKLGADLHESLRDLDVAASMLVAGDLSAGLHERSPAHVIEGAVAYDAAITSALEHADLGALDRYGPEEAQRVTARGWAPLVLAAGAACAAHLHPVAVRYHAPLGVGGVVARFASRGAGPGGRLRIAGGRGTGVVEKQTAPSL